MLSMGLYSSDTQVGSGGGGIRVGQKEKGQYQYFCRKGVGLVTAKGHMSLDCMCFVNAVLFPDSPRHPLSGRCAGGADTSLVPETPYAWRAGLWRSWPGFPFHRPVSVPSNAAGFPVHCASVPMGKRGC